MEIEVGQLRRWIVLKRTLSGSLQHNIPFVITSIKSVENPSGNLARLVDLLIGNKVAESFSYDYIIKNSEIVE